MVTIRARVSLHCMTNIHASKFQFKRTYISWVRLVRNSAHICHACKHACTDYSTIKDIPFNKQDPLHGCVMNRILQWYLLASVLKSGSQLSQEASSANVIDLNDSSVKWFSD